MKIILKIFISIILILLIITTYLSTIGIETDRFNNQIKDKIKSIDEKTVIQLKKIKLVLDPFKLKINIKTIGSKLINQKTKKNGSNLTQLQRNHRFFRRTYQCFNYYYYRMVYCEFIKKTYQKNI